MLRWIVRDSLIRLYDISSIIIFSASVNIVTWGLTLESSNLKLLVWLISSFFLLVYSGQCSYWLCKEVDQRIINSVGVENHAINEIKRNRMSFKFQRHFISAICFFIGGVVLFILFVNYTKPNNSPGFNNCNCKIQEILNPKP